MEVRETKEIQKPGILSLLLTRSNRPEAEASGLFGWRWPGLPGLSTGNAQPLPGVDQVQIMNLVHGGDGPWVNPIVAANAVQRLSAPNDVDGSTAPGRAMVRP